MTQREKWFLLGGLFGGFAVGYAVCWWFRPLPQLLDRKTGVGKLTNPARTVLQAGESIDRMKPVLQPIARNEIPSPSDLYKLFKE